MELPGKRLTLLIGAGAVLLFAVLSVAYHEEIATAYYLERMKRDPELVVDCLEREQTPAMARAVDRFARSDEAKRALLDAFLSAVAGAEEDVADVLDIRTESKAVVISVGKGGDLGLLTFDLSQPSSENFLGGRRAPADDSHDRLQTVLEFLGKMGARDLTSPGYPGRVFSFLPPGAEFTVPGVGTQVYHGEGSYVCVVTKASEEAVEENSYEWPEGVEAGDPEAIVPLLEEHVRTVESGDEEAITRAWDEFAPVIESVGDEAAVPHLKELLEDERSLMRVSALWAFAVIGPAAGDALPALIDCRDDEDVAVRTVLASTLARVDPGGARARQVLKDMLEDESSPVRIQAARALWAAWRDAEAALPTLLETLKDRDAIPSEQYVVLKILRDMGPAATEALPLLRQLVRDAPDYLRARDLREMTDEAIAEISRR